MQTRTARPVIAQVKGEKFRAAAITDEEGNTVFVKREVPGVVVEGAEEVAPSDNRINP